MFDIDPHPELVAVQRPAAGDIMLAAALFGWLPEECDRLRPAVPADGGTVDLQGGHSAPHLPLSSVGLCPAVPRDAALALVLTYSAVLAALFVYLTQRPRPRESEEPVSPY